MKPNGTQQLFDEYLAQWNHQADILAAGMRDMENHGFYAVWMPQYLDELKDTYVALAILLQAGAKIMVQT